MNEQQEKMERHSDLFTREQAAYYLGVHDLSKLPEHLRPSSLSYGRGLYHRSVLNDIVERAKRDAGRTQAVAPKGKKLQLRKA